MVASSLNVKNFVLSGNRVLVRFGFSFHVIRVVVNVVVHI